MALSSSQSRSKEENILIRQVTTLMAKHVLTSHTVWVKDDSILWKIPYFAWIATLPYLDSATFLISSGYEFRLKMTNRCGMVSLYVQLMNAPSCVPFSGAITLGVMDQGGSCHRTQSFAVLPTNKSFTGSIQHGENVPNGITNLIDCDTIRDKFVNVDDILVIAACIRYRL